MPTISFFDGKEYTGVKAATILLVTAPILIPYALWRLATGKARITWAEGSMGIPTVEHRMVANTTPCLCPFILAGVKNISCTQHPMVGK